VNSRSAPARLLSERTAFTALEVLIAASVLAMLLGAAYKVFSSVSRVQTIGQWNNRTTMQIRNGLSLLRNELSRASRPVKLTQSGMVSDPNGSNETLSLHVKDNSSTITFPAANQNLMSFFICQPAREGIPGMPDIGSPEVMVSRVSVVNGSIVYTRELFGGSSAQPTSPLRQVICENPEQIILSIGQTTDPTELAVNKRNFVRVNIIAHHPKYPDAKVSESIEAPFEVPIETGNIP